ncbi:PhzF family phenazine biosynthesis protein [Microbacterium sp.]|uniref:PhzF family phenazine biosynthesis protein n=1 Tax=Microbacterium sp. TaxID=51671 RepID=UPI003C753258
MADLIEVVDVFVDEQGRHGNPLGILWSSPQTRKREQEIARDAGFSETIFIDRIADGSAHARIFTPVQELPFAGHPTVGLAAWLLASGDDIRTISLPAGSARVRQDGDLVYITALPQWAPEFSLQRLDSPADVEAIDPDAYSVGLHYVWAWISREDRTVRARMFAPELGVREDEATGSAAVRLSAELGHDLDILQGAGSRLYTHVRYLGQQVEVGGRTSPSRMLQLN